MVWTQQLQVLLYIKKGTSTPYTLAIDFSLRDNLDDIEEDAKQLILSRLEDIYDQLLKRREKFGVADETFPIDVYYSLQIIDCITREKIKIRGKVTRQ